MRRCARRARMRPNAKRGRCCHRPRLRFRPGPFDPGRFPIEFQKSKLFWGPIREGSKQASRHPSNFHEASPASVCRTSFRQAGDHPRTSFRQAGDCPFSALFPRANPASRPSVPLRASPSIPFRSPFEQALRAAFRNSLARRLRFRRTPEKWVRLWVSPLPRASSRLPHQSVLGVHPEGYRPSRHWRRLEFLPRCRLVTPDRERSE